MEYLINKLRPSLDLFDNSEKNALLDMFIKNIPNRIELLRSLITCNPKYQSWESDFSTKSINHLNEWFDKEIVLRQKTQEELEYVKTQMKLPSIANVSPETLDERTESLCIDIGIYFGEALRKKNHSLYWTLPHTIKSKNKSYSRLPIVSASGFEMDPIQVVRSTAILMASRIPKYDLVSMYHIWENKMINRE